MRRTMIQSLTALAVMSAVCSCEYKDFDEGVREDLRSVAVRFRFDHVDSIPTQYRVCFWPVSDVETRLDDEQPVLPYRYYDMVSGGSTILIPEGTYGVTAWNHDGQHSVVTLDADPQHVMSTSLDYRSRGTYDRPSVLDSIYGGMTVLDYPDYITSAREERFTVDGSEGQELTLVPDSACVTVHFAVHGIGGLSWVKDTRSSLNNVAAQRMLTPNTVGTDSVAVMFEVSHESNDSLVYGQFYIFGKAREDVKKLNHKMVLFFWMDGGNVFLPIDVSGVLDAYRNEDRHIYIDVPSLGIDLRDFITSKNNFDIDVTEWEDVQIDIHL